jgi:hypothetical protein
MPRKVIVILLIVALSAFIVYLAVHWSAAPVGIEAKGGDGGSEAVQYAALATSGLSLATALVGLLKTLLDGRETRRRA